MFFFATIFVLSSAGILLVFGRRYLAVERLSPSELQMGLKVSRPLRDDFKENYISPVKSWVDRAIMPRFWKSCEKTIIRTRLTVLRFETRLKRLSEDMRGRHTNLDVSEKSEYWEDLNGAKSLHVNEEEDAGPESNLSLTFGKEADGIEVKPSAFTEKSDEPEVDSLQVQSKKRERKKKLK